ncbi:sulfate/molybdate ABC transporter ATP-binding protein [Agathobacter sp.]
MSLIVKIKKQLDSFELSVDMELEDEIVSVIGMSGSGKSMTLKCIAGIETPDSGFISLNGRVLYDSEKHINLHPRKRRVGYLFQDYALFPTMTVMENICIAMGKRDVELVRNRLDRYGLTGMADKYPARLSGGQRQRVAMIRMLAAEPECILLDEPFSALDEHIKRQMETELMEMLYDVHKPIVFVSHNRGEVYRLADRIGSMEHGTLSMIREKKDFFRNPMTVEQAQLVGCTNISPARWIDETHIYAEKWDMTFAVPEMPDETMLPREAVGHVGIFPQDIISHQNEIEQSSSSGNSINVSEHSSASGNSIHVSDHNSLSENIIPIAEYSITEELSDWEVQCKLNNDSTIIMSVPKTVKPLSAVDQVCVKEIHLLK